MRRPLRDILDQVEWFEHVDTIELSATGSLLIGECARRANPAPVLENVMASEAETRERCKRGDGGRTRGLPRSWA
jgi:hypothetical protein